MASFPFQWIPIQTITAITLFRVVRIKALIYLAGTAVKRSALATSPEPRAF